MYINRTTVTIRFASALSFQYTPRLRVIRYTTFIEFHVAAVLYERTVE